MKQTALAALLYGFAASGHAALCTPHEYAQYKDRATDRQDRLNLADQYCRDRESTAIIRGSANPATMREVSGCDAELAKMSDALQSAKDDVAFAYAINGCQKPRPPMVEPKTTKGSKQKS